MNASEIHRLTNDTPVGPVRQPAAARLPVLPPPASTSLLSCLKRREVAGLLQVSVWTVDRMVANGEIRATYVGRLVRFLPEDVAAFLKAKAESGDFSTTKHSKPKTGAQGTARPT